MNFCRKCECDFVSPGTCNCFAPAKPTGNDMIQDWAKKMGQLSGGGSLSGGSLKGGEGFLR